MSHHGTTTVLPQLPQGFWGGFLGAGRLPSGKWGCSPTSEAVYLGTPALLPPPTAQSPWHPLVLKGQESGHTISPLKQGSGQRAGLGRAAVAVTMLGCSGAEGSSRRGYEFINTEQLWMLSQGFFFQSSF